MPFDPGHEFEDVQIQLYGRLATATREAAPRVDPAPMSGFVFSAENAAQNPAHAAMVISRWSTADRRDRQSACGILEYIHQELLRDGRV
jgi:hypothetical protein